MKFLLLTAAFSCLTVSANAVPNLGSACGMVRDVLADSSGALRLDFSVKNETIVYSLATKNPAAISVLTMAAIMKREVCLYDITEHGSDATPGTFSSVFLK